MLTHKETQAQGLEYLMRERTPSLYDLIVKRDFDIKAIKKTIVPNLSIISSNTNLAAAEVELTNVEKKSLLFRIFYQKLIILTLF